MSRPMASRPTTIRSLSPWDWKDKAFSEGKMKMPSIVMRIKTIKRLAIAWWLVSVAVNFGIAFEQPDRVLEVERSASVYHSYEFSEIDDTPPPKGFKPFYVSHYGRRSPRQGSLQRARNAHSRTRAGSVALLPLGRPQGTASGGCEEVELTPSRL